MKRNYTRLADSLNVDAAGLEGAIVTAYKHVFDTKLATEVVGVYARLADGEPLPAAEFTVLTPVGQARVIAPGATDLPRLDLQAKQVARSMPPIAGEFSFSRAELNAAATRGIPLPTYKATAAKASILKGIDDLFFNGDAARGIPSLLDQVPTVASVAADGTGSSAEWGKKKAAQILRDIIAIAASVRRNTEGQYECNRIVMADGVYTAAGSALFDGSGKSALRAFAAQFPGVTVEPSYRLPAGTLVAMHNSPATIGVALPVLFEVLEEQPQGLNVNVPVYGSCGGSVVLNQAAIVKASGL